MSLSKQNLRSTEENVETTTITGNSNIQSSIVVKIIQSNGSWLIFRLIVDKKKRKMDLSDQKTNIVVLLHVEMQR